MTIASIPHSWQSHPFLIHDNPIRSSFMTLPSIPHSWQSHPFLIHDNPIHSSFMTNHRVCNKSNTMSLEEQELPTLLNHLSSRRFYVGTYCSIISFLCSMSLFYVGTYCSIISFLCSMSLFCPFSFGHCIFLYFFELWLLITPLVSSRIFSTSSIRIS
jgi:hypothetical protein